MRTKLLIGVFVLFCAACQPAPASLIAPTPTEPVTMTADVGGVVEFALGNVDMRLTRPPHWEAFPDGDGMMLTESLALMSEGGALEGIQIRAFLAEGFLVLQGEGGNWVRQVLNQITQSPELIGEASVTAPEGFRWGSSLAAYYLMNSGDGNVTMVLAVEAPRSRRLIVFRITAPVAAVDRVRAALFQVFDGFSIDGTPLPIESLDVLPAVLEFPRFRQD